MGKKMIKEIKIGEKTFMAQTTYYIYNSDEDLQNSKPFLTTSKKSLFRGHLFNALKKPVSMKGVMGFLEKRK